MSVTVRAATEADQSQLRELWEEFEREVPEPAGFAAETWTGQWPELLRNMERGAVLLAADAEGVVGMLDAAAVEAQRWHVETVAVRQRGRKQGIAKALLLECVKRAQARGATHLSLGVLSANHEAEAIWRRLGFEPVELTLSQTLATLEPRLAAEAPAASHASTHVQTDDRLSVERALMHFVPKLGNVELEDAAGGWIRIVDPILDTNREAQARLARELSDTLGAVVVALSLELEAVVRFQLYERGRMVDEYLSVPTFYGPLSRGDELALQANPTLVARLTGANREEVHRVARTAASPAELPAPAELYAAVAGMMGLEP